MARIQLCISKDSKKQKIKPTIKRKTNQNQSRNDSGNIIRRQRSFEKSPNCMSYV